VRLLPGPDVPDVPARIRYVVASTDQASLEQQPGFGEAAMPRRPLVPLAGAAGLLLAVGLTAVPAGAGQQADGHSPGAPGAGDPYFPMDGNGGYDARHYTLRLTYDPATNRLTGEATLEAEATQDLSAFNLDLDGLRVRAVHVDEQPATWSRAGGELTVTPADGIDEGSEFVVHTVYDGVPRTLADPFLGDSGFVHTDDGALVAGQPHGAATWYPVNDHPSDKATYTFHLTVPQGREAVANGRLAGRSTQDGWTTWTWQADAPMASYLTTATMGQFRLHRYPVGGVSFVDAVDPDLSTPFARPRTGSRFAVSQMTGEQGASYKRLTREIRVPRTGGRLRFWVKRETEWDFDFLTVEARRVGTRRWTTLRDRNGHTRRQAPCHLLSDHPFLRHYLSERDGRCRPRGTTGRWHAADGTSNGWEQWRLGLRRWAGKRVEVSISYVSDSSIQMRGVFVDDIRGPRGRGSTSFERDGNMRDGWRVRHAPPRSPRNQNNWIFGTVADNPPSLGDHVDETFARHGEILTFLERSFGSYPFDDAGGIVDDHPLFFALETQTRPVYSPLFWEFGAGDAVVVHELAHQWYGDSLTVATWRNIWLNEGFATYAEWLWAEEEGFITVDDIFGFYADIPARDPFWHLAIGDPGAESFLDGRVYERGALTLHALRRTVGDDTFFTILQEWSSRHRDDNVTTEQFVALAEELSGEDLDPLFEAWLYTPRKPTIGMSAAGTGAGERVGSALLRLRDTTGKK
jgi:hypothetical protein